MKKARIILLGIIVLTLGNLMGVDPVFAASSPLCTDISGTVSHTNSNVKNVYFDGENAAVDISVIAGSGATGFAPKSVNAGCAQSNFDKTFNLKGYVWGDNLGFISLFCDGKSGKPGNNRGVSCGEQTYGVKVESESGGQRLLSGFAWNEVLGYINFSTPGQKVVLKPVASGSTTWVVQPNSWVYSQAGLWMKLDGLKFELPEENPKEVWDNPYCADKEWACVEVRPVVDGGEVDPDGGAGTQWGYAIDDFTAIADGKQGYEVHLYLRDGSKNALKLEDFNLNLEFDWKDSVKLNQMYGKKGDFSNKSDGLTNGGGVIYKPLVVKNTDFVATDEAGHYVLNKTVRSLAPTSNANLSLLSGVKNSYLVKNGVFFSKLSENGVVWTDQIESNDLYLKHVKASLKDKATGAEMIPDENKVIYSNGEAAIALKFRPPVELDTLYANNKQDYFTAYRNIPMTFTVKAGKIGEPKFSADPKIDLKLTYAEQETKMKCYGNNVANFSFSFYEGGQETTPVKYYNLGELNKEVILHGIARLMTLDEWKKDNPEKSEDDYKPCDFAQGPTLYSEVSYGISDPVSVNSGTTRGGESVHQVKYYHNLLPRIDTGKVSNPTIFVSGNVYTSSAFSTSSEAEAIQTSGNINVNVVRNTIYENVKKYTGGKQLSARKCEITSLSLQSRSYTEGCGVVINPVGGKEQIFYAKDDITLKLGDSAFTGRKIIVSDGGNIYIDKDVYNENLDVDANHLTLVALKKDKYGPTGNVYLHPDVKNFQGTIIADGSFRSYFGDKDAIDDEGRPNGDFNQMLDNLNNQFRCDCNVFSRNTIGGADLPAANPPKPYLLLGTGEAVNLPASEEDRLKAIKDDLNYLRLFTLDLEVEPDTGLPKDQNCGKFLSVDDMAKIAQGDKVYFDGKKCDGINPLKTKDKGGDLVPEVNSSAQAKGMSINEQYLPVYIYYTPIPKDSILFGK